MTRLLFALSLICCTLIAFPENNKPVSNVENLSRELMIKDSLIKSLLNENKLLTEKESIESVALNTNTNLFNGISAWLTIVAILLTLFAIGAPILNYFLVIKPNRKGIKKLKTVEKNVVERVEKNFENYMADFEKKRIKKMIALLKEPSKIPDAVGFLMLSSYTDYDEEDLKNIVDCLKRNPNMDEDDAFELSTILINTANEVSEYYFKYVLETYDDINRTVLNAVDYFVLNGIGKHFKYLKMVILSKKDIFLIHAFMKNINYEYIRDENGEERSADKQEVGEKLLSLLLNDEEIREKMVRDAKENNE